MSDWRKSGSCCLNWSEEKKEAMQKVGHGCGFTCEWEGGTCPGRDPLASSLYDLDYFLRENMYSADKLTNYEMEGVLTLRNIEYQDQQRREREKRAQDSLNKLKAVGLPRRG